MSSMFGGPEITEPIFSVEPVTASMEPDQGPTPEELVKDWMRSRLDAARTENAVLSAQDLADGAIQHFIGYEWAAEVEANALRWAEDVLVERAAAMAPVTGALSASAPLSRGLEPDEYMLVRPTSPVFDLPHLPPGGRYAPLHAADGWLTSPEGAVEPKPASSRSPWPARRAGEPVNMVRALAKRYAPDNPADVVAWAEEKVAMSAGMVDIDFLVEQALIEFHGLNDYIVEQLVMDVLSGRRTSRGIMVRRVGSTRYAGPDFKAAYMRHIQRLEQLLKDYKNAVMGAAAVMKQQTMFEAGMVSQPLNYEGSVDSQFDAVQTDGERIIAELDAFITGGYDSIALGA